MCYVLCAGPGCGGWQQRVGDLSLLAGSPEDAYEHYREAITLCKAAGDTLWCGGAMEGLAAALIAHAAVERRVHPGTLFALSDAVARCREAIGLYESTGAFEVVVQVWCGLLATLRACRACPWQLFPPASARAHLLACCLLSFSVSPYVCLHCACRPHCPHHNPLPHDHPRIPNVFSTQARLKLGRYLLSSPVPPPPAVKKGSAEAEGGLGTHGVVEGRRGHYIAHGMEMVTAAACCPNVDPAFKVGQARWLCVCPGPPGRPWAGRASLLSPQW